MHVQTNSSICARAGLLPVHEDHLARRELLHREHQQHFGTPSTAKQVGHSRHHFLYLRLFNTVDSKQMFHKKEWR